MWLIQRMLSHGYVYGIRKDFFRQKMPVMGSQHSACHMAMVYCLVEEIKKKKTLKKSDRTSSLGPTVWHMDGIP